MKQRFHDRRRSGRTNSHVLPKQTRKAVHLNKPSRGTGLQDHRTYEPPEDWHEPENEESSEYRIVVRDAGPGYQHVLTPDQITDRLSLLPEHMISTLEVVQLSCMTRKKRSFPCYGMQWGKAIYLYPVEESLVEYFCRPPRPQEYNEARLYGGRWIQDSKSHWRLVWKLETIQDFYLNNVLIHELGHLLDQRNTSYRDRERYAEWFAIHYGYRLRRGAGR